MTDEQLELVRLAEQNLLGSLFVCGSNGDTEPINKVRLTLTPDDFLPSFREGLHRRIFQAMLESSFTDQLTVAQTMFNNDNLKPKEISYMCGLVAEVIGIDYEHYATLVKANAETWRLGFHKARFKGAI